MFYKKKKRNADVKTDGSMQPEDMQDGRKVKNKGLWRKFFHLVRLAKVPWIGILFYLIISMGSVYIAVRLPQVDAEIYTGNASAANIAWVICVELASALLVSVMLVAYGIIGGRIDRNFRDAIWNKILHLEPKYFDTVSANTLLSRMTNDAESLKDFLLLILQEITGITTTVATVTAMSTMNKGLAVVMIVFVPVIMVFGFLIGRLKMRFGNQVKYQMANLTDYLSGQLARITVIKAFNRQEYESGRGDRAIEDYYVAERKMRIAEFIHYTLGEILGLIPDTVLILVGIYLLESGKLTPAGWIVFHAYATNLMTFFTDKIEVWINVKEYQGHMNRLSELFSAPEEGVRIYIEETVQSGDLVFDDVSFSYGDQEILKHASLTFPKQKFTVIFGPSGTGKTTILKLIERIYEPQEGQILLNGRDIRDYKLENFRRQIAYVRQDTPMISGTIRDNILYGVETAVSDEEIMKAAKEVRADAFLADCPGGLDYEVGQFGEKLSGGQRQKLSVLRAFLQNREYILLDEPTASLDIVSSYEVMQSVLQLVGKRTVILVSHDDQVIRNADHVIVVEDEAAVLEGTAEEVCGRSGFLRQMMHRDINGGEAGA